MNEVVRRLGVTLMLAIVAVAIFSPPVADGREVTEFVTGSSTTGAGAHPDVFTTIVLGEMGSPGAEERTRSIRIDLPPGLMGNPLVVPPCPRRFMVVAPQNVIRDCPPESQVGTASVVIHAPETDPIPGAIYVVESGDDTPAQLVVAFQHTAPLVPVTVDVRTESDFGVASITPEVNSTSPIFRIELMLWGVPNANQRGGVPYGTGTVLATTPVIPAAPPAEQQAFMTNPTVCDAPKLTTLEMTFYGAPDDPQRYESTDPTPTDCSAVPFDPSLALEPTTSAAGASSGLEVDLRLPQSTDPTVTGTSHLHEAVVTLPDGVSLNPSAAAGLGACTDEEFGDDERGPARCPDSSKIGTLEFDVPLLKEKLHGSIYLGAPLSTDPQSGQMLRIFQYAEGFGLHVKIPGYAKADPVTGRITATFEDLPQTPFSSVKMSFKRGARGILATPEACGTRAWNATLAPWSGTVPVQQSDAFRTSENCALGFAPTLAAGMDSRAARGSGKFSFRFARRDGEQYLRGLTARLPEGLLASVSDVPLCSNAAANAGACPAASRIGVVDAKAGAGDPFVLEHKGEVFLTEGYKGGAYGLAVKIRPVAGPFRGAVELSPIVVRQAIHVDRTTAQVTAVSDPFPLIHHGIPLRVREITVVVDRSGFMLNPSSCGAKQVTADLDSARGATHEASSRFQVSGCAGLPFKPKLALRLTGRGQVTTGRHPGVRAQVTQAAVSEAGIEKAVVRLPKSLALDPNNAQALCEFEDGTKPDLENHCPKGSIVGRARARTPLLNRDLVGNVYFVKNVRTDPKTGNRIRTLPMIVVALRGEIAINLKGVSSTTKAGKLVNAFASVPDAPISRFNLNIKGGKNGILAVTRTRRAKINLCAKPAGHVAEADMDGQNGRRYDRNVRMKTPCTKKQTRRAKRAARRAAARR